MTQRHKVECASFSLPPRSCVVQLTRLDPAVQLVVMVMGTLDVVIDCCVLSRNVVRLRSLMVIMFWWIVIAAVDVE